MAKIKKEKTANSVLPVTSEENTGVNLQETVQEENTLAPSFIPKDCFHDWVFSLSYFGKNHPGKKLVVERCTKCNDSRTIVNDV